MLEKGSYEKIVEQKRRLFKKIEMLRNYIQDMPIGKLFVRDLPLLTDIFSVQDFNDPFIGKTDTEKRIDELAERIKNIEKK